MLGMAKLNPSLRRMPGPSLPDQAGPTVLTAESPYRETRLISYLVPL